MRLVLGDCWDVCQYLWQDVAGKERTSSKKTYNNHNEAPAAVFFNLISRLCSVSVVSVV